MSNPELKPILDYFEKLKEVDVEGVEPLVNPTDLTNVLRPDDPKPSLSQEEAMKNAPESKDGYFVVPRVVS